MYQHTRDVTRTEYAPSCGAPLPEMTVGEAGEASAWAVANTKSRCEKCLVEYFQQQNVPCFLPMVTRRHVYGKRVREYQIPLFSGYVFFDAAGISHERVFASRRVCQVLTPPDPVQLWRELSNVSRALTYDQTLRETIYGQPGRPVWVARGVLKGLCGKLVRYETNSRLVIDISFLGKAAELAIDDAFVEPVL